MGLSCDLLKIAYKKKAEALHVCFLSVCVSAFTVVLTILFFVEIQFVERGFMEQGFMESVQNVDCWKAAFGGKYDSWKLENL